MTLARQGITTISKLKQIAQQEGCYDLPTNDRTKTQNNPAYSKSKNSPSNNHASRNNYNTNYKPNDFNQNNARENLNNESHEQLFKEFAQKLDMARSQNPINHDQNVFL